MNDPSQNARLLIREGSPAAAKYGATPAPPPPARTDGGGEEADLMPAELAARVKPFAEAVSAGPDPDGLCMMCCESMLLDPGSDPSPMCHTCAQSASDLMPAIADALAEAARLRGEVERLTAERDGVQKSAAGWLVAASVNEVARKRLNEHEHREYVLRRLADDLLGILSALNATPGGMNVGNSVRHTGMVDVGKLHRAKRQLDELLSAPGGTAELVACRGEVKRLTAERDACVSGWAQPDEWAAFMSGDAEFVVMTAGDRKGYTVRVRVVGESAPGGTADAGEGAHKG